MYTTKRHKQHFNPHHQMQHRYCTFQLKVVSIMGLFAKIGVLILWSLKET